MKGKIKERIDVLTRTHQYAALFDESKRLRVLVVEDEVDYRELIERYVISFGYECLTAEDGEHALALLADTAVDLVITDMMMPKMNGMALLRYIGEEFCEVATIVLTGYGQEWSYTDIIRAGACEFIEKPVAKNVLEAKIERVFREKMLLASYQQEIKRQQALEQRYQAVTNGALDGIIMMNGTGCISFWNPAAERLFGYTEAEAMGMNLHELLAPAAEQSPVAVAMGRFLVSGQGAYIGKTAELLALDRHGRTIPIELSLSSLQTHDGWQAVAVVRDITARKRLEREKESLSLQLRQAQKMEAIGTLAGGIAHDFNNILGAVIGFADMAKDEVPKGSQVHADLERILSAGYRARDLVRQILTFSRRKEEEHFPLQVQVIIKEAVKLLRATIPANIEIRQCIDPQCALVMADPSAVHQCVMNLCTNAYQAMRNTGGELRITLENVTITGEMGAYAPGVKAGAYVKLTVADTGEGMRQETVSHIFEPYFSTNGPGPGVGLGLSVVHGIVQGLGGAISAQSEYGTGTTVAIWLPAVMSGGVVAVESAPALPRAVNERVLLVEDEMALLEITSRKLTKLGYTVTGTTSSAEALEIFAASPHKFDLIVTDLAMPEMTGVDMANAMLAIRPGLLIILTTGFVDTMVTAEARHAGIKKIIAKPMDLYEVASAMREVLA